GQVFVGRAPPTDLQAAAGDRGAGPARRRLQQVVRTTRQTFFVSGSKHGPHDGHSFRPIPAPDKRGGFEGALGGQEFGPMTPAVQALLASFESLSESGRQEAAVEILRRMTPEGDPPEQALVEAADELFRLLDAEEAADARP